MSASFFNAIDVICLAGAVYRSVLALFWKMIQEWEKPFL
ncbi:hypothetical protein XSR1_150037 [Xenorhabdus szentirmaii DSM 16338]|uniref:Uncharacterized protein n=1 Tax=Xenorhabdus szentirmaii DSM 16338 TaxID=1427518 RepID=W1IV19_9GAMM|nr:hypothetical protein XSR1_150037 [Xenorhabdus szentirmaii DSM 16338]